MVDEKPTLRQLRDGDGDKSGVACPRCGSTNLEVLRTTRMPGKIRRERGCLDCGKDEIYTTEMLVGKRG